MIKMIETKAKTIEIIEIQNKLFQLKLNVKDIICTKDLRKKIVNIVIMSEFKIKLLTS